MRRGALSQRRQERVASWGAQVSSFQLLNGRNDRSEVKFMVDMYLKGGRTWLTVADRGQVLRPVYLVVTVPL